MLRESTISPLMFIHHLLLSAPSASWLALSRDGSGTYPLDGRAALKLGQCVFFQGDQAVAFVEVAEGHFLSEVGRLEPTAVSSVTLSEASAA